MHAETYLLPHDGSQLLDQLHADLGAAQQRLLVVCFLPPCPRLLPHLEAAAHRVKERLVLIDGSTQQSLRRFDAEWMQRVVLHRHRGTVHAKVLLADGVLWWGSWNMSVTALQQYDVAQRTEDPQLVKRVLAWAGKLTQDVREVACGSAPRGAFATKDHGHGDQRHAALLADPNYDPELGF